MTRDYGGPMEVEQRLLERAETLERAEALGPRCPYVLQAAIAACHARAGSADATDWSGIAARYGELVEVTGSPIVELNRAVAVAMADGPARSSSNAVIPAPFAAILVSVFFTTA